MESQTKIQKDTLKEKKRTDYIYMVSQECLIISLSAELDHHLADEMREVIDGVIDNRKVYNIIFDFSKINFMDSAGIGLIMGRYKKVRDNGVISLVGINDSIQRILLISGLHKIVHIFSDVNQAVRDVKNNRGGK